MTNSMIYIYIDGNVVLLQHVNSVTMNEEGTVYKAQCLSGTSSVLLLSVSLQVSECGIR